ncbi:transcription termination factor 4%2C mitochondrial [Xyrichtys novacula]|uniref:Transcription termination factor 4, mitochondrial n=1 Tax=Xyrichtys novacula TaxID=13765 RepID=A0AAV1GH78_XYRNO|nr:transcription termination factor 4%2C mitochondrial [Xyrichtys novacula]
MSFRVAARQVISWTIRGTPTSVPSPLQFGTCHLHCRLFCSPSSQSPLHPAQQNPNERTHQSREPVTELSIHSLRDLGFTETQAEQICGSVSKIRGGNATKHAMSTLTALFILGLNASSVLKLLEKCPEVFHVKESLLQQRIDNLRKLGLVEGSLQRVVAYYPQILTVPVKRLRNVVMFLREKCLFTGKQVTDILRESPAVVLENMSQLEYKFQYVYFRMGVKQAEMLKSRLFRFTLDEVRCRHCFLERRGMYETPDKKGQTTIINPKLESILNVSEGTFVTDVAMASAEEYDVFKKLMEREWREEEQQMDSIDTDHDDEEEEEEDMAGGGKNSYKRRKRK